MESWLARPRNEALVVAAVVLASLGLRVAHVLSSQASPLFEDPQMDALYHVEWARALAAGQEFQDGPYFRAPLYPWALGAVFALFGDGLLLPRLLQALLGAGATLLVHGIGRRVFDRRTGVLAAALAATSWIWIFYDGELLLEALATPLYLLGLWLTLRLGPAPTGRRLLVVGAAWGLSALARPNVLLFLVPLAVWVALREARASRGGLFVLGVLLPILPVTAINAVEGDAVLISYQAGVNLWIGNNPASDGSTAIAPGTRPDWWGGFEDTHGQAREAEGRDLRPSEVSRHYARRTVAGVAEDPARWVRHMLWKLRLFCMDWELGNNEEPRFLARRFSPFLAWLPVSTGMLLAFAAVGALVAGPGRRERFPLWGFALVYSASVVLFFVSARFRLPVLGVLAVYAAWSVVWMIDAARAGRRPAAAGALALGLVLTFAARALVPVAAVRNSSSNGPLLLAQAESRSGHPDEALRLYAESLAAWPASPVARMGVGALGRKLYEAGDHEGAVQAFELWSEAEPGSFDALFSLGRAQLELGRDERALATFERALEAREPAEERYLYEAYGRAVGLAERVRGPGYALALARRMAVRFPDDDTTAQVVERLRIASGG